MRLLILLDTIIIVRYIFTFHSKNPTAVQDEFWTQFVNVLGIGEFVHMNNAATLRREPWSSGYGWKLMI